MAYKIPQKQAPLKQKVYKNKYYLAWLHENSFKCLLCDNTNLEAHHLESGAKGRPDNKVIMLCSAHHRGDKFSAHGCDAKQFKEQHLDEMEYEAERLFKEFIEEEGE